MSKNQLLFFLTSLIVAFGLLVVLPNFSLELGSSGYRLEWRGLSSLGISENLFNFARGRGIYNKTAIEFVAEKVGSGEEYAAAFARDKFAITKRLAFINSTLNADIYLREELPAPGKRTVLVELPASVPEDKVDFYAQQLTSTKSAQIVIPSADTKIPEDTGLVGSFFPGYRPAVANLSLTDVVSYAIDTSSLVTYPILRTQFNPELSSLVKQIFATTSYDRNSGAPQLPMLLVVNGVPEFWAFHPDLFGAFDGSNSFPTSIIWIPFAPGNNLDLLVNIATIFGEQPELKYTKGESKTIAADFAPEGRTAIAVFVVILFAALLLISWRGVGFRGSVYFGFGYLAFILTIFGLAKLFNLPVEPMVLITITSLSLVVSSLLLKLFSIQPQKTIAAYNLFVILLFIASTILLQFPAVKLIHSFEAIFVVAVASLAAIYIYIPAVSFYAKENN